VKKKTCQIAPEVINKAHKAMFDDLHVEPVKVNKVTIAIEHDAVNHPSHYVGAGGLEPIDAIESWGLDFYLGNVLKYIVRAGKKNKDKEVEDLEKAKFYLQRKIDRLKKCDPKK
jgi:Protein of unknwon function (DUF3310)